MRVLVLAGGLSSERNVSLSSGFRIAQTLREMGDEAALIDVFFGLEDYPGLDREDLYAAPLPARWQRVDPAAPDLDAVRALRADKSRCQFGPGVLELCREADVVFLALHGSNGEDGRVQAAFDLLGVPYTGSGYLGSALAMDKDLTKRLVSHLVQTPRWSTVRYTAGDVDALVRSTPLPCVVKPVDAGSSIGVSIARDADQLRAALLGGLAYGGRCVLEQYIQGREIQVGVLDGQALPPIEIIPKTGFYDYANKYQPGAAEEVCPAPISPELDRRLRQDTLTVFHALGLSAYSRADFIVDSAGVPWFLEINTLPGMTPTSLLPQEAQAVGVDYGALCRRILQLAIQERG